MVFKLIRIDAQSPSKIQLSTGVHVIGRGKFLHNDHTDKRVSRNHAKLEVTNDIVILKALHQNPCFFIKKNTDETELLQRNCTTALCHGDRFGLIPDHFWFEVLQCQQDTEDIPRSQEDNATNGLQTEVGVKDVAQQNGANSSNSARDSEETIHYENNEEDAAQNHSCSPSIMNQDQESTDEYESKPEVSLNTDTRTPVKRSNSSTETSPIDVKKVKTEPDDGVDSGAAVAGPSNGQAPSDSVNKTKDDTPPALPNNVPSRERCIYGDKCYRRNPQHKAQFSHPADADWGAGERGACPYGRACSRRDPRHWDSHLHPPGTQPPQQHALRPGQTHKRRQRKTREVTDSEDSEEGSPADLIVTGKRARKTIQRQDLETSESEGEKDPFGTDESDEWQPPSDLTGSQDFSQAF